MTAADVPSVPPDGLDAWIARHGGETSSTAELAAQRHGDAELVALLRSVGCEGPLYEYFEAQVVPYAVTVVASWLRDGTIFWRARKRHRAVPPKLVGLVRRTLTPSQIPDLTAQIVAEGMAMVRTEGLLGGKWKPSGGASLRTYVINACLMRLRPVLVRWAPDTPLEEIADGDIDVVLAERGLHVPGADEMPVGTAAVHELIMDRIPDEDDQRIVRLRLDGITGYTEIARRMGPGWTRGRVRRRIDAVQNRWRSAESDDAEGESDDRA